MYMCSVKPRVGYPSLARIGVDGGARIPWSSFSLLLCRGERDQSRDCFCCVRVGRREGISWLAAPFVRLSTPSLQKKSARSNDRTLPSFFFLREGFGSVHPKLRLVHHPNLRLKQRPSDPSGPQDSWAFG